MVAEQRTACGYCGRCNTCLAAEFDAMRKMLDPSPSASHCGCGGSCGCGVKSIESLNNNHQAWQDQRERMAQEVGDAGMSPGEGQRHNSSLAEDITVRREDEMEHRTASQGDPWEEGYQTALAYLSGEGGEPYCPYSEEIPRQQWTEGREHAQHDLAEAGRTGMKILRRVRGKWVLYSHKGRVLGRHPTRAAAERQERAIAWSKHRKAMSAMSETSGGALVPPAHQPTIRYGTRQAARLHPPTPAAAPPVRYGTRQAARLVKASDSLRKRSRFIPKMKQAMKPAEEDYRSIELGDSPYRRNGDYRPTGEKSLSREEFKALVSKYAMKSAPPVQTKSLQQTPKIGVQPTISAQDGGEPTPAQARKDAAQAVRSAIDLKSAAQMEQARVESLLYGLKALNLLTGGGTEESKP